MNENATLKWDHSYRNFERRFNVSLQKPLPVLKTGILDRIQQPITHSLTHCITSPNILI